MNAAVGIREVVQISTPRSSPRSQRNRRERERLHRGDGECLHAVPLDKSPVGELTPGELSRRGSVGYLDVLPDSCDHGPAVGCRVGQGPVQDNGPVPGLEFAADLGILAERVNFVSRCEIREREKTGGAHQAVVIPQVGPKKGAHPQKVVMLFMRFRR